MQKSGQMTNLKDLCVYLLLYQSLYDLTDQTVCNLKSVLVLTNALGRNLISVLDLTNPPADRYQPLFLQAISSARQYS